MDARIKDYFKRYPQNDEVYECGGVLFHTEGAAQSFGGGKVSRYVRQGDTKQVQSVVPEGTLPPTSERTYKELLAECRELGIETADNKKETLIEALNKYNKQNKD